MKVIYRILIFLLLLFPINAFATSLPVDVTTMSIDEIQSSIDKGYFNYEELVKVYLERIEKYNSEYNAIINVNENALKEARKLDVEYKKNGRKSDLFGIPIVLKDNIDYKKMPTTNGTEALADSYPKENAVVTKKLIDAGAIIIGKANMSEFALEASSSRGSYGQTLNAYNTEYTPYGSSGGVAVAVAANLAVAGIGTDTNSSIRTPSSANNVVGLRPTYNLVSTIGVIKYDKARDTVGPITKYVSDNAIILSIINEEGKTYLKNKPKTLLNTKIGVIRSFMNKESNEKIEPLSETYDQIVDLMNNSIKTLKKQNATMIDINEFYSLDYDTIVNNSMSGDTLCYEFNKYIKNTNSNIKSFDDLLKSNKYTQNLENYNKYCFTDYLKVNEYKEKEKNKEKYKKYIDSIFKKYDLDAIIYPTTKNKLIKIDNILDEKLKTNSYVIAPSIGYPSLNVPIGFDNENLPYGMEILSKSDNEYLLYKIGYLYEKNTNYYKLPDIAPSTYKISNELKGLVNYYEKSKSKKFDEVNKETKEFLTNYTEDDEKVKKLYNKYKKIDNSMLKISLGFEKNRDKIMRKRLIYLLASYAIIFTIFIRSYSKVRAKRKKKKIFNRFKNITLLYMFITILYFLYEYLL